MSNAVDFLYSALYDATVPDWPGEIVFYRTLVEAVYGDFDRRPLSDDSSDMIWVARSQT